MMESLVYEVSDTLQNIKNYNSLGMIDSLVDEV